MKAIDLGNLGLLVLVAAVVRQVVMTFGNPKVAEGTVVAVVAENECGHARRVRLKRQHQHVIHELDIFSVVRRNAGGRFDAPAMRVSRNANYSDFFAEPSE